MYQKSIKKHNTLRGDPINEKYFFYFCLKNHKNKDPMRIVC